MPKVIVIETNMLFRKVGLEDAIWRELENNAPVLEYHNRWKTLTPADITAKPKSTWTHPAKGFRAKEGVIPSTVKNYMKPSSERERMSEFNK